MAPRIFLAHASQDKEQVRRLYRDLRTRGFDPWFDEEDLEPGQVWKVEIPKAIRQAGVFLACLSSQSVDKVGFVQYEFRFALSALAERPSGTIFLIPLRLDECDVPDLQIPDLGLSLRDIQRVDLWEEGAFDRLVRALEKSLKKPNEALPQPDHTVQLPLGVIPDRAPDIITSDDAGIEEFLRQPISDKTLSYYTRWKYPGRPVDHAAQGLLLEDLVYSYFKTIKDVDLAIGAAVDAVDYHRKEDPNTFQTGTDFLIVSLGFVDTGFRARHCFSSQTRKQFPKYEHLIKWAGARRPALGQQAAGNPLVEPPPVRDGEPPSSRERIVTGLAVGGLGSAFMFITTSSVTFTLSAWLLLSSVWLVAGAVSGGRRHGAVGLVIGLALSFLLATTLWIKNDGFQPFDFVFAGVGAILGVSLTQSRPIPGHEKVVAGVVGGLLGGVVVAVTLWYYFPRAYVRMDMLGDVTPKIYWVEAWRLGIVAAIAGAISCARWLGIITTSIGGVVGSVLAWSSRDFGNIFPFVSIGLVGGALLGLLLVVVAERAGVTSPIVKQSTVSALLRAGLARLR